MFNYNNAPSPSVTGIICDSAFSALEAQKICKYLYGNSNYYLSYTIG